MKKLIIFKILLFICALPVMANTKFSQGHIARFYTDNLGMTYVGFVAQPADTCDNWSEHVKFDSTTDGGKNMLTVLIAAKLADRGINLWYFPSQAPGTNQANGCTQEVMAVLAGIGLP